MPRLPPQSGQLLVHLFSRQLDSLAVPRRGNRHEVIRQPNRRRAVEHGLRIRLGRQFQAVDVPPAAEMPGIFGGIGDVVLVREELYAPAADESANVERGLHHFESPSSIGAAMPIASIDPPMPPTHPVPRPAPKPPPMPPPIPPMPAPPEPPAPK